MSSPHKSRSATSEKGAISLPPLASLNLLPAPAIPPTQSLPFCPAAWANARFPRPIGFNSMPPIQNAYGGNAFVAHYTTSELPPAPKAPIPAWSTSPQRTGRNPFEGLSPRSAEAAKFRAARARASAQVSANFRTAYHPGRSPSLLKKEESKSCKAAAGSHSEKQRREERKLRAWEEEKRRILYEKQEHARVVRLWMQYLAQWNVIMTTPANLPVDQQLTARHLPCPLLEYDIAFSGVSRLSKAGVEAFFVHPAHSEGKSRKERIRAALLQWHPDKFEKWMCKFRENRRPTIRDAVDVISRHLTEILKD